MKSLSTVLAVFFALGTLVLGGIAWRSHEELLKLRATTAAAASEHAELQKRIWDAERRAKEMDARVSTAEAALRATKPVGAPENPAGNSAPRAADPSKESRPSPMQILAFLNNPETQRMITAKIAAQVESRYADLFKNLNVSPDTQAQVKQLLVERHLAAVDVVAAMVQRSMQDGTKPDNADVFKLAAELQLETERKLETALGPGAFAQYETFENAQLFRGATANLQAGMSRIAKPLSDTQTEQFTLGIATLAQTSFSPEQQAGLRELTRMQQARQTMQQVEQLYRQSKADGEAKPAK